MKGRPLPPKNVSPPLLRKFRWKRWLIAGAYQALLRRICGPGSLLHILIKTRLCSRTARSCTPPFP
jgi:hypothetical protein